MFIPEQTKSSNADIGIEAESEKRSRSVPGGTVGVRIGRTLNPRSSSSFESSTARRASPVISGCMCDAEALPLILRLDGA